MGKFLPKVNKHESEKFVNQLIFFFRSLREWTKIIQNLSIILTSLIETHQNRDQPGCLVSECDQFDSIFSKTYFAVDLIPFYAENIGFHLCSSVTKCCKYITSFFSSYHTFFFERRNNLVGGIVLIFSFVLYLFNSKLRCKQNVKSLIESSLKFVKVFRIDLNILWSSTQTIFPGTIFHV